MKKETKFNIWNKIVYVFLGTFIGMFITLMIASYEVNKIERDFNKGLYVQAFERGFYIGFMYGKKVNKSKLRKE